MTWQKPMPSYRPSDSLSLSCALNRHSRSMPQLVTWWSSTHPLVWTKKANCHCPRLPKIVLDVDKEERSITVPDKGVKRATVAVEDTRLELPQDSFANMVQKEIKNVDDAIDDIVPNDVETSAKSLHKDDNKDDASDSAGVPRNHEDAEFSECGEYVPQPSASTLHATPLSNIRRGERVMVYWPDDDTHYAGTTKHLHREGQAIALYKDSEKERLNLDNKVEHCESSSETVTGSSGAVSNGGP